MAAPVAIVVALGHVEHRRCLVARRCRRGRPVQAAVRVGADARLAVALAVVVLLIGALHDLPALAVVVAALAIARRAKARTARRREERSRAAALPQLLEEIGRHLRAGGSVRSGVLELATRPDLAPLLGPLTTAMRQGAPLDAALDAWRAARAPGADRRLAAAALALGAETGGPQAWALDGVATTLRERAALAAEVHALAAQARVSTAVLTVAPIAFGLLAAAVQPASAHFLLREPAGVVCLAGGAALLAVGWSWMQRMCEAVA
jgi:tight adherence protein B